MMSPTPPVSRMQHQSYARMHGNNNSHQPQMFVETFPQRSVHIAFDNTGTNEESGTSLILQGVTNEV